MTNKIEIPDIEQHRSAQNEAHALDNEAEHLKLDIYEKRTRLSPRLITVLGGLFIALGAPVTLWYFILCGDFTSAMKQANGTAASALIVSTFATSVAIFGFLLRGLFQGSNTTDNNPAAFNQLMEHIKEIAALFTSKP